MDWVPNVLSLISLTFCTKELIYKMVYGPHKHRWKAFMGFSTMLVGHFNEFGGKGKKKREKITRRTLWIKFNWYVSPSPLPLTKQRSKAQITRLLVMLLPVTNKWKLARMIIVHIIDVKDVILCVALVLHICLLLLTQSELNSRLLPRSLRVSKRVSQNYNNPSHLVHHTLTSLGYR